MNVLFNSCHYHNNKSLTEKYAAQEELNVKRKGGEIGKMGRENRHMNECQHKIVKTTNKRKKKDRNEEGN